MSKLDLARIQVGDDTKIEQIAYYYYGKYFKRKYLLYYDDKVNGISFHDRFAGPQSWNIKSRSKFIVNSKFENEVLKDDSYFCYIHGSDFYYELFTPKVVAEISCGHNSDEKQTFSNFTYILADSYEDVKEFAERYKMVDIFQSPPKNIACNYVLMDSDGNYFEQEFELSSNYNINVVDNYNDDLPEKELTEFVRKNGCGLSLFHGLPGTGKSSYIKNLIYKNGEDVDFYILDSSLLGAITQSSFVSFLSDCTGGVFILEDCEKLLMDRNVNNNPWIGTLLNLTDGILGEALKLKFICTFNCDISSIDKALLREGRLDVLYEFKPLCKEKTKALCEKLEKTPTKNEMTLAEIYKSKVEVSKLNKKNKVGF